MKKVTIITSEENLWWLEDDGMRDSIYSYPGIVSIEVEDYEEPLG